jgi:cytidine deaminase
VAAVPGDFGDDPVAPLATFRIDASEVRELLAERGCTMDALLLSLLRPAARLARPPVSNYHVG